MSYRFELKYVLNYLEYIKLRNSLRYILAPDAHANDSGTYRVTSMYFDDMYNSAKINKHQGVSERRHYRIRQYNNNSDLKFEIKIRKSNYIRKESLPITRDELKKLINGDAGFLLKKDNAVAEKLFIEFSSKLLAPRVIVDYEREAFVHPLGNTRITFDSKLTNRGRSELLIKNESRLLRPLPDNYRILEVKYNNILPSAISLLLSGHGNTRIAVSKFMLCSGAEQLSL